MITFENIGLHPDILTSIHELGFQTPMPIQAQVIPFLLDTRQDLIGLAQTGTGKTAAFGLPLIQLADRTDPRPQALILAPTRELCLQIATDLKHFAKYRADLHIVAVYGGADIDRQIRAVKKGAQIIVATPGRMNDLLNKRKTIDLSVLKTAVLDEADEMLNMGFKEELDAILAQTPATKQTLLFSATMPQEVLAIAKHYMHAPQEIAVGPRNAGAEQVEHLCYLIHPKDRYLALKRVVDYYPEMYGLIFCRTRQETQEVATQLIQDGYNADALHGDLSQGQREHIMHKFRIKNLQLLVATDVAARGLDVKEMTHVINYNLPDENDVYIHRSGRTGRAGKEGISIALVTRREFQRLPQIEAKLKKTFTRRPIPAGQEICEKQLFHLVDRLDMIEVDHKAIDRFLPDVYEKLEWLSREDLIKHFVSLEFNRFLDYYRDAQDLNVPEEPSRRKREHQKPSKEKRRSGRTETVAEEGFTRFFINLGYKDSVGPSDLIGLINRCTRKRSIEIGRIDLMKSFAFFEVAEEHAFTILSSFKGVEYNHRDVVVEVAQTEEIVRERSSQEKPSSRDRRRKGKETEKYSSKNRPARRNKRGSR